MTTLDDFRGSVSADAPPAHLAPALQGLWWLAKGDWDRAHRIVQDESDASAAWVHAYLHRVEGDQMNAGGWYKRAGKTPPTTPLEAEWEEIARALLAS